MTGGKGEGMTGRKSAGMTVLILGLLALAACQERGRPDPSVHMAVSHEQEQVAGTSESTPAVPSSLEVPPEVEKAYSGIRLAWKDSKGGKEGTIEVPIGGGTPLPDSDLEVRAEVFLPAFTMSREAITSSGTEEANPAARITVVEKDKQLFSGWIFTRFPDVHPFQHPRFSLRLEGGVRKKAA